MSFGSYASEASTFFGDPSGGANGIDFAGNGIDSIALERGADFQVTPIPDVRLSFFGGTLTVRVFGTPVPEPTTLLLTGGGVMWIAARRRIPLEAEGTFTRVALYARR